MIFSEKKPQKRDSKYRQRFLPSFKYLDQALPEAGMICELPDTLNQYIPIFAEEYNSSWLSGTSEKGSN